MGIDTNLIVGQVDYDICICAVCTDIFEDVIMLKIMGGRNVFDNFG